MMMVFFIDSLYDICVPCFSSIIIIITPYIEHKLCPELPLGSVGYMTAGAVQFTIYMAVLDSPTLY